MRNNIRKIALLGILTSFALVLSYIEFLLPPIYAALPGIKVGLPNLVIIFVLYKIGVLDAVVVSLVRLFASALLFGNMMTFVYSLAGAVVSLTLMALLKRFDLFSEVGVSVVGGVSHNAAQVLVASVLLETPEIGYYMIVLSVTGTVAGLFIGLLGSLILKKFSNFYKKM